MDYKLAKLISSDKENMFYKMAANGVSWVKILGLVGPVTQLAPIGQTWYKIRIYHCRSWYAAETDVQKEDLQCLS